MNRFIILYETEAACLSRLEAAGFTGEPAREIACYLAQATDLQAFRERITAPFVKQGIAVDFFEVGETDRYLPLIQADPAGTTVWNVTDGFRYYRASFASSAAQLLGAPTFGSPPQAQHLAQDKYKSVTLARSIGIVAPPTVLTENGRFLSDPAELNRFDTYFVKPNTLGAKVGIFHDSKCTTLEKAVELSRRIFDRYADRAVIQGFIEGVDVRVSFMRGGESPKLGVYKLANVSDSETGGDFMTMQDNWTLSASRSDREDGIDTPFGDKALEFKPQMLNLREIGENSVADHIESAVWRAVDLFQLKDYFSFDFRVTPDQEVHFLEFEVCPAVTIYDFQTYLEQSYGVDLPQALLHATRTG